MNVSTQYLTDDQMRRFIAQGYLILQTDFPDEFHETLNAKLSEVMEKEGNPGNNILPRLYEVHEVFQHAVVRGALTSILGPNYLMHPHRHCHFTYPGRKVQGWHKDSYWGHQKVRNHHNWWAMIFYYPQAVDEQMGPSGLLPGTQYYAKRAGDDTEQPVYLEGTQGTFALIHYDLWHRGGANLSHKTRAMMKFQFVRMDAPTTPAWNNQQADWLAVNGDGPPVNHNELWAHQWHWHCGGDAAARPAGGGEKADRSALVEQLASSYEPQGVDAAYRLAGQGGAAIPFLLQALTSGNVTAARNAGYGLSAVGRPALAELMDALHHETEEARMHAAFALGESGQDDRDVTAALVRTVTDESVLVRRTGVEAIGLLKEPADVSVPALIEGLADKDRQVRFTAALSLQRIGPHAAEAVPALQMALGDENRYVRANAVDALRRIGTAEALEIALDYLSVHRWCPTTTPENLF